MKYDRRRPCNDCPFRREGGIRLRPSRALEIANAAIDWNGGSFACHKTTIGNEDGDLVARRDSSHCAGALILAEKLETATQLNRIAGRLGMYDPRTLDRRAFPSVFDSVEEMVEAQRQPPRPPRPRQVRS